MVSERAVLQRPMLETEETPMAYVDGFVIAGAEGQS